MLLNESNTIDQFIDRYDFLSNSYPLRDGSSVEAQYQAMKSLDPYEQRKIAAMPALEAKAYGESQVELREDWEHAKVNIMTQLVARKFHMDLGLRSRLDATGNSLIVAGYNFEKAEKGAGKAEADPLYGYDLSTHKGANLLGVILMCTRANLPNRGNR